jgi:hypothetical protein
VRFALAAVVTGLALTACGEPEPAGGALPPPSDVTNAPPTSVRGSVEPFDATATIRPELMVIEPSVTRPGDQVLVNYPGGRERGIAYVLEWTDGSTWHTTHFLTATTDGYGVEPNYAPFDSEGYAWVDIGFDDAGPDKLVVPDSALAGPYRICTANSVKNVCAELTVIDARVEAENAPSASGPTETTVAPIPVVAVHEDVEYYIACADVPVRVDGTVERLSSDWVC